MSDLAELVKEQCMGLYYGGVAEHNLRGNTSFGFENQPVVDLCNPSYNFSNSIFSLNYWTTPKEIRDLIKRSPEKMRREGKTFFFHYLLDKERFRRNALAHNKKYKKMHFDILIDFSSKDFKNMMEIEAVSCVYNNFLGETIYVGDVKLMQELVDKIKAGFESAEEILSQLTSAEIASQQMKHSSDLTVYDLVKEPRLTRYVKTNE